MSAIALLNELQTRGVSLAVLGDRLHVEAPSGVITQEIKESLTAHKAELLVMLADGGDWDGVAIEDRENRVLDRDACGALVRQAVWWVREGYPPGAIEWAVRWRADVWEEAQRAEAAIEQLAEQQPTLRRFEQALDRYATAWAQLVLEYRASVTR